MGTNAYIKNLGHMTKMAAVSIYNNEKKKKNTSKIFCSRTCGPISTKFGMKLKLRSFKSSEQINEERDGPYRGFDN